MQDPLERAQHYRDQAAKLRAMAAEESDPKIRKDLLALADQYDRLCKAMLAHPSKGPK